MAGCLPLETFTITSKYAHLLTISSVITGYY